MIVASPQNVATRFLILHEAREICASDQSFQKRQASLRDFTPEVLAAFGEGFIQGHIKTAFLGQISKRMKQLWGLVKRAPELWTKIKELLGIEKLTDIPKKIKAWAKQGYDALKKSFGYLLKNNPVTALYFVPKDKMPGVTDVLGRLADSSPKLSKLLQSAGRGVQRLDQFLAKHKALKIASAPLKAAIFIWIWLNVAELSWDIPGLIAGFTGQISVGELLASLPESGLGLVVALLFPALGTFALLPVTIIGRVLWLLAKKLASWIPGKGFLVHWSKIEPGRRDELVPVF